MFRSLIWKNKGNKGGDTDPFFAMDYWAELDNQMCYKKNAGQIENVERATKDYSDVIAKVDNQMLELRRQIENM